MSKLTDKASYLKGFAAGLKLNMEKETNQVLMEVLNLLGDMAEEMQQMAEAHEELNEYVESIDDDLADLEETLFGDDDEHFHTCDCEDDDCDCCHEDEDEDMDEVITYACPTCGHEIEFKASSVDFDEDYLCPACGKPVFPELEEEEEDDLEGDDNE